MKVIKPPSSAKTDKFSVFLAGSIEMGKAEDWQTQVAKATGEFDVVLFNPRREDWDNSWKQTVDDANFLGQVSWEYDQLEQCKLIFLYFDPKTKAPISLLELGLFAGKKKIILCCPDGFYRKGNVEFIANKFKIKLHNDLDSAIKALKKELFPYGV